MNGRGSVSKIRCLASDGDNMSVGASGKPCRFVQPVVSPSNIAAGCLIWVRVPTLASIGKVGREIVRGEMCR